MRIGANRPRAGTGDVRLPCAPRIPDLANLPRELLEAMRRAGEEVLECRRVLRKGGLNVVGELLRGQGTFFEHEHYPSEDVFDAETAGQYYYHAHRGYPGEHGHFHTFLRAAGMPRDVRPVSYEGSEQWPTGKQAIAHLIAVSMDAYGEPIALFAVNRWVTGDTWYPATDVARMLPRFEIDHAHPSWPVNRWLSALLRLYRPHIEALLAQRDQVLEAWRRAHPESDVYEDRGLDVTGWVPISVESHVAKLGQLAARMDSAAGVGAHAVGKTARAVGSTRYPSTHRRRATSAALGRERSR